MAELREALADGRVWSGIGVVWKPPGESSHYEIDGADVLVEVQLMPNKEPLYCRLAAGVGTKGGGMWIVPAVGTEVAIMIPLGDMEQADPMIVAVLSSGSVPAELDGDTLVIVNPKKVVIKSTDDKVYLGDSTGTEPGVLGDQLKTRVETLENAFKTHKHASFVAVPDTATSVTGSPDFRAQKVQVK